MKNSTLFELKRGINPYPYINYRVFYRTFAAENFLR